MKNDAQTHILPVLLPL